MEKPKYPKWRYHRDLPEGRIVNNEEEDKALGAGWEDTPAGFEEKPDKQEPKKAAK